MLNVHVIGEGNWYNKISQHVKNNFKIVSYNKADWVFVFSDVSSHYDLVNQCINDKKNVFCEKPLTLNYSSSLKLFSLAEKNNVRLYVDDVFAWHNIDLTGIRHFYWHKRDVSSFLERFAYHHFYMIFYNFFTKLNTPELVNIKKISDYSFNLYFNDCLKITFDYSPKEVSSHTFENLIKSNNAFERMILTIVKDDFRVFDRNKDATLFSVKIIEQLRPLLYKKIAIVGAGIFGLISAIKLSSNGFVVDVFEKNDGILKGASGSNEYRVHRGYHYPRSMQTALECKESTPRFEKIFKKAIDGNEQILHMYSISKHNSKVNKQQFEDFLTKLNVEYKEKLVDSSNLSGQYFVEENLYDPEIMKSILSSKLYASDVKLHLNSKVKKLDDLNHDYKVVATYSANNYLINNPEEYQFEIVEKPLVKLPKLFRNISNVIMDGPFFCYDPLLNTDYHLLGNVTHAIHKTNVGKFPDTSGFEHLINKGLIKNPSPSKINLFIGDLIKYYPNLDSIKHVGSYFTVRTVLKNRDFDDARPTYLKRHDENIFSIFSGKIVTSLDVADNLVSEIKKLNNKLIGGKDATPIFETV